MEIFGLSITRQKTLSQVPNSNRGWISLIREPWSGAWQHNVEIKRDLVTSHFAVFACMTLIASDVSKLGRPDFLRLKGKIWEPDKSGSYDPVLNSPNQFQTPNQFWENWVLSKLTHGNTYVLKARNDRKDVTRMWVLDPNNVQVLVSDSGDVFYNLSQDNLSGLKGSSIAVPQSEIIHDRMNPIFHPLVGLSPIYAAGLVATMGLNILNNSASFFGNQSIPGGIITTPHTIPDETALRLKREWDSKYGQGGADKGGTAVMGDGLEFKSMGVSAKDSNMLEQANATAQWVCSAFHVPPYKIGLDAPAYNSVEALNLEYYSRTIQKQLEDIEACLLRGLEMKAGTKVQFCTDGLYRMDTLSKATVTQQLIGSGVLAPNEGRAKYDLPPKPGGDSPYMQEQNFSLEALAKRDAQEDPFGTSKPEPQQAAPAPDEPEEETEDGGDDEEKQLRDYAFQKGLLDYASA